VHADTIGIGRTPEVVRERDMAHWPEELGHNRNAALLSRAKKVVLAGEMTSLASTCTLREGDASLEEGAAAHKVPVDTEASTIEQQDLNVFH
jgi:hypothetical protein